MTPLATPLPAVAFSALVWGSVALVVLVFCYEVAIVFGEMRRSGSANGE
ncbi:MAG: hypothetical protein ABEJ81_02785 [Haloferacaceae archaeon]